MKILLVAINAKYIHSNLAVYSLRAAAGKYKGQIEICEYTINQRMDEILGDIYRRKPDVAAFSCYLWNRRMLGELFGELPKVLPGVRLWAGGPEVSCDAERFLSTFPQAAGVMRSEGEGVFPKLAAYYIEGTGSLPQIDGLAFRDDAGAIRSNPDAAPVDLDAIPFAYEYEGFGLFRHRIIYYESSRGCPFRCSYCLSSLDKKVRFRSLGRVKEELASFLRAGVPQVKFVDRTFNCDPERTRELLGWLLEHDNGVTNFHFEVAADLLTEDELAIMSRMRPGLIQLEIGVQSTDEGTLKRIERVTDIEKVAQMAGRVKRMGNIHQHLDLIAGLPGEDLERFQRSFDEVFAMKPEQLQLGFLKVLKGTRIEKDAAKYGICFHQEPPYEVLFTDALSYADVLLLKGVEEMVEVYYNSGQFGQTLARILGKYASPFAFFRELAAHYEEKGYGKIQHSRMARYEILREFLQEKGYADPVCDQCMVYDLYVRDSMKCRPDFAADVSPYREKLKQYTREYGHQTHVEVFEREDGPVFVLFDYRRRDPLTGGAHVERLQ